MQFNLNYIIPDFYFRGQIIWLDSTSLILMIYMEPQHKLWSYLRDRLEVMIRTTRKSIKF